MSKNIVFTGGGTAGHVTPNIALIEILKQKRWNINYIASKNGIERKIISELNIPYSYVRSGKLRRYFSWQNFLDPFNLLFGVFKAYFLLRKLKADIIFSKGGFVALPVVIAGFLNRIPVIIHESDITPGLANRLSFPFANKICINFAETGKYIKYSKKIEVTGTPIREKLLQGNKEEGLRMCGFNHNLPCLLVMGGGLGSIAINKVIRESLPKLTQKYQVIHLCGINNIDEAYKDVKNYRQFEYVNKEMADLFAASDIVVSRAGANSVCEILALQKPHVFIPLSAKVSRGDQIQNANYFAKQGISIILEEEKLSQISLLNSIAECEANSDIIVKKMQALNTYSSGAIIFNILQTKA